MSEIADHPAHIAAIEAAVEKLDCEDLATKINAIAGSCLLPDSVGKVARMVGLSAIRTGRPVEVCNIRGVLVGGKLSLTLCGEIAEIIIPTQEEI
jgi:hypothetical protein